MTLRWHVLCVEPRRETAVEALLAERSFETLLPLERWRDETLHWLIPGYLFVLFDLADERWKHIPSIRYVGGILPLGREPVAVGETEMDRIRALCPNNVFDPWPRRGRANPYQADDVIRIVNHPLAGQLGTVRWTKAKSMEVLTTCFDRVIGVEIRPDQAEFAPPETQFRDNRLAGTGTLAFTGR